MSHHLTWHRSSIYEDLHKFARNLQHMSAKLFLLLFQNNFVSCTPKIDHFYLMRQGNIQPEAKNYLLNLQDVTGLSKELNSS